MIDACKTSPRHLPIRHRSGPGGAVIQIQMIRSDTSHPDKCRRHQGRAWCEVAGRCFETRGPAPIYKLTTLLWLHGHGGTDFEVHDDVSPFGKPGGLAMRGKVRNWARLVKGKPKFDKDAPSDVDFSPNELDLIARAAGNVAEIDSPRPDNGRTAPIAPLGGPTYPQQEDGACTRQSWPQIPGAARASPPSRPESSRSKVG